MLQRKTRKLTAIALTSAMIASLAGCGAGKTTNNPTTGNSETTTTVQTETTGTSSDTQVLNLRAASFGSTFDVQDMSWRWTLTEVDEGLVRAIADENGNDQYVPAGAEYWDVSEDGLVYTFHLRENACWSDGQPVTAADYEYGWKRLLNPENAYDYAPFIFNVVGAEEYYNGEGSLEDVAISAEDDYTFVVKLKVADPTFESKLVATPLYPTRQDKVEAAGDSYASDYSAQVYNGPFYISSFTPENAMTWTKNEYYWDAENVSLDEVNWYCISEATTAALMFDNGELDAFSASGEYIAKYDMSVESGEISSYTNNYPMTQVLCYELVNGGKSGLMNNVNIRKALSFCLNRQEMCDAVYGRYQPAYGLVAPAIMMNGTSYRELEEEPVLTEYNEYAGNAEAIQALFQQGLDELGITTPINEISLTFLTYGSGTDKQTEREYIKQSIESALGITVNINAVGDFSLFKAERDSYNFDFFVSSWSSDYNDPLDFFDIFRSDVYKSYGCYSSEEYDALLDSLAGVTDTAQRQAIYAELEHKLLVEDCATAPLVYGDAHVYTKNWVKDFHTSSFGASQEVIYTSISGRNK